MKIPFYTLLLAVLSSLPAKAQNYTPSEEFKYRTKGNEYTIDQFQDDSLPAQCSGKSQTIYSLSKSLKEKIENEIETSGCQVYVAVDYSDIKLMQKALGKNSGTSEPLTETFGIYVERVCGSKHQVFEMSWEIKGTSPSCTSLTYINGIYDPKKTSSACSMADYLRKNEAWISGRIIIEFN
jgi:hypothetical protein